MPVTVLHDMRTTKIPLDSAPAHSEALGRMLGHWAIIEHSLSYVLGALLGIEQSRQQMLFNTFISIASKIQLIERLVHSYVIDSPEKECLQELIGLASTYNTTRNSFVHSTWAVGKDANTLTKIDNRVPSNTKRRIRSFEDIQAKNIEDFVTDLSILSARFTEFSSEGFPKIKISERPIK